MIDVERWGRLSYGDAWSRQLELAARVEIGARGDTLVVVEHPPTITLGRHAPTSDVLANAEARARLGIETVRSDRGGRATFHGPGQVVVYPIVHIERRTLGIKQWVGVLQAALLEVVRDYGPPARCREGSPGVWVRDAKVASIGLRVSRGVSYHGVSLNVGLDVAGFDCIVPCGAAGERITSLAAECETPPSIDDAADRLIGAISRRVEAHPRAKESTSR